MKKLLTALAVVAGLGFVMSCSDEVSDYTIGAPEAGVKYTRSGVVEGTYTYTTYEFFPAQPTFYNGEDTSGNPIYVENTTFTKGSATVNGKTYNYWYRPVTYTTKFKSERATIAWEEKDKDYSSSTNASSYTSLNDDSRSYSISFGNPVYSGYSYTVTGLPAGKQYKAYQDGIVESYGAAYPTYASGSKYNASRILNQRNGAEFGNLLLAKLTGTETVSDPSDIIKVGDAYFTEAFNDVKVDVNITSLLTGDIEDDTFTVTDFKYYEKNLETDASYYTTENNKVVTYDEEEVQTSFKATRSITFTFTALDD